jgi:microcystin-dependent protein
MSDVFVGEILLVPYNFAPTGFAFCEGQLLPISQNTALFSLLGTNYGGNGTSTFGLPDLRGAVPIGAGQGPGLSLYDLGQTSGATSVTLTPAHRRRRRPPIRLAHSWPSQPPTPATRRCTGRPIRTPPPIRGPSP